eukprot:8049416-Lingulodinium_polyedra.AAC.1
MRQKLPVKLIQVVDPRVGKDGVKIYCECQRLSLFYLKSRIPVIDVENAQRPTYEETRMLLDSCAAF